MPTAAIVSVAVLGVDRKPNLDCPFVKIPIAVVRRILVHLQFQIEPEIRDTKMEEKKDAKTEKRKGKVWNNLFLKKTPKNPEKWSEGFCTP